ncbi:MAG: type II toxin-antitoxin system VapC family toxin [Planctomycetaceae bacterium]
MTPILIDTNAYAAYKRNHPDAVQIVGQAPMIGVSTIVLGELYSGFAGGTREAQNRQELARFLTVSRVRLFVIDPLIAERYAEVSRQLRAAGRPIPTNDMWIAATALQYGYALYSYDNHFHAVRGLRVGTSPADFSTP